MRVLFTQSALVLELLHGQFLRGERCWCVRGAHSERKPVRREFGLVLGHGQVISNDQVSDNFVLALELGRLDTRRSH